MVVNSNGLQVSYSARGIPTYQLEIWHEGLKKHRIIRGADADVVQRKGELQIEQWENAWEEIERRENQRLDKERLQQTAIELTQEARNELDRLRTLLQQTLRINDAITWDDLKDTTPFPEPPPAKPAPPRKPLLQPLPKEPTAEEPEFQPRFSLLDRLSAGRKERVMRDASARLEIAKAKWTSAVNAINEANSESECQFQEQCQKGEDAYQISVAEWSQRKSAYEGQQEQQNRALMEQRERFLASDPQAVVDYCDLVLSRSAYPPYFPQEFRLDYQVEPKVLGIDYSLPSPDRMPTLQEIRFVKSRNELAEQHMSATEVAKLYDDALYQICLRTIHEIFEADVIHAIDSVVFNGWVRSTDRGSGNEVNSCILTVQARKDQFASINLAMAEPKACFKSLKGVGSSKLHSLAAVAPLLQLRRDDGRFVSAQEVVNTLTEADNLAIMDWEEFEHLIRELFEKEFSTSGGEVKVTRASRDGGVDAVVFDPDPLRGGKIVIQAKRYVNTVDVAAVRDLYGTVVNEGANKGILVTTSDYGPDAYAFAAGKPLVLLNGANLLHLLEKHGQRARIDIKEARAMMYSQMQS